MNLNDRLAQLKNRPIPPDARPLAELITEPLSKDEIRQRREDALRRDMKARGKSDADVDAYLGRAPARAAVAA